MWGKWELQHFWDVGWGGVMEEGRAVNLAMTWRDGKKQGERLSIFVEYSTYCSLNF